MASAEREFSTKWVVLSVFIFIAAELLIGMVVGDIVIGKYVSRMFYLKIEVLMHLGSFFLGGLAVGLLSPGIRILEPAVGAFISVGLVLLISFFMPHSFYRWDFDKLLIGGAIAFVLALLGARLGEKLMGNVKDDDLSL